MTAPRVGVGVLVVDGSGRALLTLRGHPESTLGHHRVRTLRLGTDIFALLDRLGVKRVKAIGVSAGANTLLHMATQQPSRIDALIHVSGTPRFPQPARMIMRTMTEDRRSEAEWTEMRGRHVHGDDQIRALWRHARGFADDRQDMNFDAASLSVITARSLIVHGDRDPLYPVELAVELYRAIPASALWVVPNGGHGPIFGDQAGPFVLTAAAFLDGG